MLVIYCSHAVFFGGVGASVEKMIPFFLGQRAPKARFVAAVADGIVSPIGHARVVIQIAGAGAVRIIVGIVLARRPRLVTG